MASLLPRTSSSTGKTSWRVLFRIGKVQRQETFSDVKAAEGFKRQVELHGGEIAVQLLRAKQTNAEDKPTLAEFTRRYLDAESGLLTGIEDGTRDGYQREAERTFLAYMGEYPIDAIDEVMVGRWVGWQERQTVHRDRNKPERQRAKVSAKTVKNAHALLSAVLTAAVKRKLREDNPAHGTRLSKGLRREGVFLSPAEFATILHFTPEHHRKLILFLAGTGCRWGEATAMTWSDLTLHAELPTVRVTKAWKRGVKSRSVLKHPKSSKARRTISLFPDLVAALGEPGDPSELLFRGREGGRIHHAHFSQRVWARAVAKAQDAELCREEGLQVIGRAPNLHDLRHTHASWLISRGVPLPYIQARLGHEKITTTVDTYGHLVPDAHEQMASVVAATLAGVSSPAVKELPQPVDDEPELEFAEVVED